MKNPSWLNEVFEQVRKDYQQLPEWARPIKVPGIAPHDAAVRGSTTEQWLKRWRDKYNKMGETYAAYGAIDDMLDDYRLHADLGLRLDQQPEEDHW